jgi:hypothetical protein
LPLLTISVLGCVLAEATGARAADQPKPPRAGHEVGRATQRPPSDPPLPPGEADREMPDYDGRGQDPTRPEDVLLWVPRVVLFPAYLVSEYVIRRPVGAVLIAMEKHHVKERWHDFFTFADEKVGIFPTGAVDLGFRTTIGFYAYWLDVVGQSDVKLRATTGGLDSWTTNALWRLPLGRFEHVQWTADFSRRPDRTFYGLGAESQDTAARYREHRFRSGVTFRFDRGPLSFRSYGGLLLESFDPAHREAGDGSLADAIAAGVFSPPPALEDGVLALQMGVAGRVDSRPKRITPPARSANDLEHESGTGAAVGAHVSYSAGLKGTRATPDERARPPEWLRYGGSLVGALDVTGTRRTLELEAVVEFVEPLPRGNSVPFTQQVPLGGDYPLRAFRSGRLVDLSAIATTLSYRWPIWDYLDGSLHYGVGDVFSYHLRDFAPRQLRSSFGIGMNSAGSLDHPFETLIAFGTETFGEGGAVESVRLVFGTRARF